MTTFVIVSLTSFIVGISLTRLKLDGPVTWGVILIFTGPLAGYLISLFVYGFGELICNSRIIINKIDRIAAGNRTEARPKQNNKTAASHTQSADVSSSGIKNNSEAEISPAVKEIKDVSFSAEEKKQLLENYKYLYANGMISEKEQNEKRAELTKDD